MLEWPRPVSRRNLALAVLVQFAAMVSVCWLIGENGWDDGAITLAFSRTFAHHGRVALTPRSETVEGFSSVAWFFLNALVALARPSYHASIFIAQVLSALCISATTLLLARTCALLRLDKLSSTLTVLTFVGWGCSFAEASNGMEMGLLAAAVLLIVNELLAPRPRLPWLATGVVLAVTSRFEAILYVGLLALGARSVSGRRAFWAIVVAGSVTVLLLLGWRLAVFSDVLPNTFWAKRWPPYGTSGASNLLGRLAGVAELPRFFLPPLLALMILRYRGFDVAAAWRSRRPALWTLVAPALGAILIGGLTGQPWGYHGRMPYFAFPLGLLAFALLFSPWLEVPRRGSQLALAAGLCVLTSGLSILTGFPSGELGTALAGGTFGVSPRTYAESGQVFRRFVAAAELPRPTILTPDLGGLALCCDEFRVVDLGLLSNRVLAHRGPTALADVLDAEAPDLIQAHWDWASTGHLYDLPSFRAHYLPAFAGGTKVWLRREVAQAIEAKGRGCRVPESKPELQQALRNHRYADHDRPEDRAAFEAPGVVLALDQPEPTGVNLCR